MATDVSVNPPPADAKPPDADMQRLVAHLRAQRLTVLVVPDAVDIADVLKRQLMPLLGRRDTDVDPLNGVWHAAPQRMPDQRRQRQAETAAFFDDWAQMARSGALDWRPPGRDDRTLLVMPRLGAALRDAGSDASAADWLQSLAQRLWLLDGRDQRPVQVLLAIDAGSLPLLELLRLHGLPVDDLLVHWQPEGHGLPAEVLAPSAAPAQRGRAARLAGLLRAPQRAMAEAHRMLVPALGVLGTACLGWLLWQLPFGVAPEPALREAVARPATVSDALPLMMATSTGGLPQPVADLAGQVGPAAGVWLAPQSTADWAEGLQQLRGGPGLMLVRYDALRAARQADPTLAPRLLTPLYSEPLLAIVRSSSRLQSLHELHGQRVRVAGLGSADAFSASGLLQAMYGAAAPVVLHAPHGGAPWLPTADDEVLLTVGRPGRPWTDALPPGLADGYRLLTLAAGSPAGQRALRHLLPMQVDGPSGPQTTLGVVTFLVASPDRAADEALVRLAQALCRQWPAWQSGGDPAWRGLQPGLQLTSDWPLVDAAAGVWRSCPASPAAGGSALVADAGADGLESPTPTVAKGTR